MQYYFKCWASVTSKRTVIDYNSKFCRVQSFIVIQNFTFNFIVHVGKSFGQQCNIIHPDKKKNKNRTRAGTVQKRSAVNLLVAHKMSP